jgi:hypothetical protein
MDIAWPLVSWRKHAGAESGSSTLSLFPLWYSNASEAADFQTTSRRMLLPFYYQGSTRQSGPPDTSYLVIFPFWWNLNHHNLFFPVYWADPGDSFACFPFYGQFNNFFDIKKIRFVLWPLWLDSQQDDVHNYFAPWPLLGVSADETTRKLCGGRLWPLAGGFQSAANGPRYFWLWPLGQYKHFTSGPMKNGTLNMCLPFWFRFTHPQRQIAYYFPAGGYSVSKKQKSVAWFWPLYSQSEATSPTSAGWKILWFGAQRQTGPNGRDKFTLLNLFAWDNVPGKSEYQTIFWPVYQHFSDRMEYAKAPEKSYVRNRTYLVPFYYARETVSDDGKRETHHTLWPLASWSDNAEAHAFNLLKLFPCERGDAVARNWEPLWTGYGTYQNKKTGVSEKRILGPLYSARTDSVQDSTEVNALFFQYRRTGKNRQVSFLFGALPISL